MTRICMKHSDSCLTLPWGNTTPGTKIVAYKDWGGEDQQWRLDCRDDGKCRIKSWGDQTMCIDLPDGNAVNE